LFIKLLNVSLDDSEELWASTYLSIFSLMYFKMKTIDLNN